MHTGNLEYYHLLEREPYESRGSRTVLMGTQGEVPWVYLLCGDIPIQISKSGTKPGTFTFLGFTHYCSKSKNGRFRVKRKTSKKKFAKKCREINQLMGHMKTWKLKEITAKLNQILTGYYHYYGITDNTERITAFRYHVMKSLFYCLNRRSQKKSYNWVEFLNMIDNSYPLVRPRIYVSVYN